MSDELFTEQVPTVDGLYYWRCNEWCHDKVVVLKDGKIQQTGVRFKEKPYGLFGPRIPTPEQCRVLNEKPA